MLVPVALFRLDIETPVDSILDRMDPARIFRRESEKCLGGDEIVAVVIEARGPFSPRLRCRWYS